MSLPFSQQLVLSVRATGSFLRVGLALSVLGAVLLATQQTLAAALPGPADASRIDKRENAQVPESTLLPPETSADLFPTLAAPEQSKNITLTLTDVRITGMKLFTAEDIKDIYAPYIGRVITLDTVWLIAQQLTERYRKQGYFLSRVIVPQQSIDDGVVLLRVVEGYIGEVKMDDPIAKNRIVQQWLGRLLSYRPVQAEQIESILLHLNDIPGVNLDAVLEPMETVESTEGAVRLVLKQKAVPFFNGSVSFDNNGSRFLGPYEMQAQGQAVVLPGQRTTLSGLTPFPEKELQYGSVKQEVSLFAAATLELYGSYTNAAPGYNLKPEEIRSNSTNLGMAFAYSLIRQRQENLDARLAFEAQNTESDILDTPLTRDYIRAFRLRLNYQLADSWDGQNIVGTTLSQGAPVLGASPAGQKDLSRAAARPDFSKANFDLSRLQAIADHWGLMTAVSAQVASGPLYTSEQFGYGGQAFGRAYDNSEITGDQGINGSTELRYDGIDPIHHIQPQPYGFYDMGAVWNLGSDTTTPYATGSSAGMGLRLGTDIGLSANGGFAFPLTKRIENPVSGNGKSPRYFMSLAYGF